MRELPLKLTGTKITAIIIIAVLFFIPIILSGNSQLRLTDIFQMGMIWVIMACSYRLITMIGQLSLAHGAWMLLGGYVTAILSTTSPQLTSYGFDWWTTIPIAIVITGICAFPVGLICLRVKGLYFIIMTFGVALLVQAIVSTWANVTGGVEGIANVPSPTLGSINFDISEGTTAYFYLTFAFMLFALLILWRMESTRLLQLTDQGIRQNDDLASSVGIRVARYKVLNFVISAMFAGLCGSLIVGYNNSIAPSTYVEGLLPMVYCIGGGREVLIGPVIGALAFSGLPELFGIPTGYEPIFFGIILIFIITLLPGGLVSIPSILRRRFGKKEEIIPSQWV
jgi:branched-chain amino acid transport system permease protein